jgi:predicted molibdopterin-dependent oxidoreductase YjgC
VFLTATDDCETFGHDLLTGGALSELEHRATEAHGRAFLKGCPYVPAHELPDEEFPLLYTTGRTVYQFHTRTKTGRARQLREAAPDAWVEIAQGDAERLGIREGDVVRVESRRGAIEVQARVSNVRPGVVFAPFHYGAWDLDALQPADQHRQANELTQTVWDPISKQPIFKTAACRVSRVSTGSGPAPAPTTAASAPVPETGVPATAAGPGANASEHVVEPIPHYAQDPSQGTSTAATHATLIGER